MAEEFTVGSITVPLSHQRLREGTAVFRRQGNRGYGAALLDSRQRYTRAMAVTRQVRTFPGGVHDLGLHVVWCPKYRRPVLGGRVATRLRELIRQKADEHGWEIVALEVMPDHVHLFVKHDPKASASYIANQFKGFTSHALRGGFPHLRTRLPTLWSKSYFAASVGAVSAATVQRYIDTQYERPWRKEGSR